ncbi:phosphoribosylglycinamide formyltransferase [Candidatus Micrarchaeota archaeon]|nr:phosphoribosylglycinamide formyltransferase [Candidatus Micrarchaeota archaeon]
MGVKFRIAVLASTRGTDLQAIIDAQKKGVLLAEIACVACDRPCLALDRAKEQGVESFLVDKKQFASREEFDGKILEILQAHRVQLVCLAGYMRILSPLFVRSFPNRIVNVHPSLLPAFAGGMDAGVHAAVLKAGVPETGCTFHLVDEGTDTGAIILQEKVPVLSGDTPQTLKERVQEAEKRLYPRVINLFAQNKVKAGGNKVTILQ